MEGVGGFGAFQAAARALALIGIVETFVECRNICRGDLKMVDINAMPGAGGEKKRTYVRAAQVEFKGVFQFGDVARGQH